ncbi:ABC transporter permease [Fulvivirga maritima]|uniref:ABC transporter permease n=1 Tax=Fulvivirga maritima TaxID=2904247 RepID=UPI001F3B712B|nr:ABC transporter permease [Fulvivirga maritima]UII26026.1 ABC transporter permease [Fulvivirga maritima]
MNTLKLSYKNMLSRRLSTVLSLVLLVLGIGIVSLLIQVSDQFKSHMENNLEGIDMVVGAKGSPLQLVLSAVYHVDVPTGNIPYKEVDKLKKNRLVASVVPLSYGDSYEGYRIVGSDHNYASLYNAKPASGRFWQSPFEVTVGAEVAHKLNLKIGDSFVGSHGLTEGGEHHDHHAYKVVGIFDYTNAVMDQLILTATESVWQVHEHHEEHGEHEEHEEHENHTGKEVTAMLVTFRNPMGMLQLPRMINESTNMQAAVPVYEVRRLFGLLGVGIETLKVIAFSIMAVSGFSIFISLYKGFKEREAEMALMRSYGASRWQLVALVLQEGLLLTGVGFILAMLVSRTVLWGISSFIESDYHYSFFQNWWNPEEWWLLVASLVVGVLASILPAIRVFHINISKTLADA